MNEREERFRRLFDACYAPLHAFARRRAAVPDADDVVAEVLTVAWRRLDDIPDGAALPWLYGVAHKILANQRRSAYRRRRLTDRMALQPEKPPPAPSAGSAVVDALGRLRSGDQEILRLAAWEGLGPREIALVLDCSVNAAALRLSRARRRLRDHMTGTSPTRKTNGREVTDG